MIMQYKDLQEGGSQAPSIGFENGDGSLGQQIAYGWDQAPITPAAMIITPTINPSQPGRFIVSVSTYSWMDITTTGTAVTNAGWEHPENTCASEDG